MSKRLVCFTPQKSTRSNHFHKVVHFLPPKKATGNNYLHKVRVFRISDCDNSMDFLNKLLFFIIIKMHVPLGKPSFASPVLNQDETNLENRKKIQELNCSNIMPFKILIISTFNTSRKLHILSCLYFPLFTYHETSILHPIYIFHSLQIPQFPFLYPIYTFHSSHIP